MSPQRIEVTYMSFLIRKGKRCLGFPLRNVASLARTLTMKLNSLRPRSRSSGMRPWPPNMHPEIISLLFLSQCQTLHPSVVITPPCLGQFHRLGNLVQECCEILQRTLSWVLLVDGSLVGFNKYLFDSLWFPFSLPLSCLDYDFIVNCLCMCVVCWSWIQVVHFSK